MATRLTPFWPRPATTSGSLWPGSGLCALYSGPLSGSSHTAAAPLHHKLKRLNSLFHRRLADEGLSRPRPRPKLRRNGAPLGPVLMSPDNGRERAPQILRRGLALGPARLDQW